MNDGLSTSPLRTSRPKASLPRFLALLLLGAGSVSLWGCGDDPTSPKAKDEEEEPTDWSEWLLANGNPLSSLTSEEFSDLQFLKPLLTDRRLVQLGESGHGVAQFNQVKVRLIKFLHQEMGFDVIAFESGIYECFQANGGADSLTAVGFMYQCPFGVWHTWEVVPLFEYIKSTQETDRPLLLAGFDIQPSSWLGGQNRAAFIESVVDAVDPEYAVQVRAIEDEFKARMDEPESWTVTLAAHADSLRIRYEPVLEFFDSREEELLLAFGADPVTPLIARQTIWSTLQRIEMARVYGTTACAGTETRDQGMATNLSYLAERVYPDKKIMAWAHNFHIRHLNRTIPDLGGCATMGQHVANRHRGELYTVGLYMYQGGAAMNNRDLYSISPAPSESLEGILQQAGHEYFFLDFLHLDPSSSPAWVTRFSSSKR
jgi:erythromycin esterase